MHTRTHTHAHTRTHTHARMRANTHTVIIVSSFSFLFLHSVDQSEEQQERTLKELHKKCLFVAHEDPYRKWVEIVD